MPFWDEFYQLLIRDLLSDAILLISTNFTQPGVKLDVIQTIPCEQFCASVDISASAHFARLSSCTDVCCSEVRYSVVVKVT